MEAILEGRSWENARRGSASFRAGLRLYVPEAAERAVSYWHAGHGWPACRSAPWGRRRLARGPVPFRTYEEVPARGALIVAVATLAAGRHRPPPPSARPPVERASLPDIEDEVMCPTCGVPLELAPSRRRPSASARSSGARSPAARPRRRSRMRWCRSSGRGAGAAGHDDSSFNWAAYLVPVAAVLGGAVIAIAAAALAAPRRRRRRRAGAGA